jgi:hypothetical protein
MDEETASTGDGHAGGGTDVAVQHSVGITLNPRRAVVTT